MFGWFVLVVLLRVCVCFRWSAFAVVWLWDGCGFVMSVFWFGVCLPLGFSGSGGCDDLCLRLLLCCSCGMFWMVVLAVLVDVGASFVLLGLLMFCVWGVVVCLVVCGV